MDADILIVDDEVDILHFMQRALTRAGYRVRTASSGALALVAIASAFAVGYVAARILSHLSRR